MKQTAENAHSRRVVALLFLSKCLNIFVTTEQANHTYGSQSILKKKKPNEKTYFYLISGGKNLWKSIIPPFGNGLD